MFHQAMPTITAITKRHLEINGNATSTKTLSREHGTKADRLFI